MQFPEKLKSTYTSKIPKGAKSERIMHRITNNPSTANPGDTLLIRCPKLANGVVMISNSFEITFNVNVSGNAGNTLVQNVSKNLFERVRMKFEGRIISELCNAPLIETYRDLYKHTKDRKNSTFYGISNDKMRSIQAGASNPEGDEKLLYNVYGNKFAYKLTHPMLTEHGSIYPYTLGSHIEIELTLAAPKSIIQSPDNDMNYNLTDICLEYESIQNDALSMNIAGLYNRGKSFLYEHAQYVRTSPWKQSDTILNENMNHPLTSLKGILMLFTMPQQQSTYDSEVYINPEIESVVVTIEGISLKVYAQGYLPRNLWKEARRYFAQNVNDHDIDMDEVKFLKDKFCLFIDLRSFENINHHGQGLKIANTKDGVQVEIRKKNTKVGDVDETISCYIYTLADAMLTVEKNRYKNVQY